ncbi:MAG: hypothetical protein ABI370_08810, partial [Gammaproteobacteria bacterium]
VVLDSVIYFSAVVPRIVRGIQSTWPRYKFVALLYYPQYKNTNSKKQVKNNDNKNISFTIYQQIYTLIGVHTFYLYRNYILLRNLSTRFSFPAALPLRTHCFLDSNDGLRDESNLSN